MTIAIILLSIVVALLTLLVAGLLRSHAEILRRLHDLGAGLDPDAPTGDAGAVDPGAMPAAAVPPRAGALPVREARAADTGSGRLVADLAGSTIAGDPVVYSVVGTGHDTVVLFLSSGCTTCRVFWDALGDGRPALLPAGTRLVVVTRGPQHESPARLAELAPPTLPVVLSEDAWADYGVDLTPYVVHVDGRSGRVRGEGTAAGWDQVTRLLGEAADDLARGGRRRRGGHASRQRRIDEELVAAGIRPGDERLYGTPTGDEPGGGAGGGVRPGGAA